MGFFGLEQKTGGSNPKGPSLEFLRRHECQVCPLNKITGVKTHGMAPTGTKKPLVYMLGEAPGAEEDARGIPFAGPAGQLVRRHVPREYADQLRWGNCVRTRPIVNMSGKITGRPPEPIEIECCRPSVERDIEATRPFAVFGFGNVPLRWATGQSNVTTWHGKVTPVKIGSHICWYFPMLHPDDILRMRRWKPRPGEYGSEMEFRFALDMKRAWRLVQTLPDPKVDSREEALSGLKWVTGAGGDADVQTVIQHLKAFSNEDIVGLDIETNGTRPYNKGMKILSVAIASKKVSFAFPLWHRETRWTSAQRKQVEAALEKFLYHARCVKVVHSLGFEQEWLAFFYGEKVLRAGRWGCSVSQAFLLDEQSPKRKPSPQSLEFLCVEHFGVNIKAIAGVDRKNLDKTPLEEVLPYNALDAKYHLKLFLHQEQLLKKQKLLGVYREHIRRVPTMVLTQMKGIPIDQDRVDELYDKWTKRVRAAEKEIAKLPEIETYRRMRNQPFRPSANQDIQYLFARVLKKPLESTDEEALEKAKHPIAKYIINYRKAAKVLSTYILPVREGEKESMLFDDGLLHPVTNTTVVSTWRTSSDGPNYQNWPSRNAETKEVRSQVRPSSERLVVSFDYGQIQARNVGMESLDKALIKAFWERYDIHSDWVERIVKYYPKWIKEGAKQLATDKALFKTYRNLAKNQLVFPSFFGAQPKSISGYLGIPVEVGMDLHEDFWEMFPDIKKWHEKIIADYKRLGYVTGLTGFRRRAPISPNQLINAPIQADEALIVCTAMNELSEMEIPALQANMEIHDDLTFIWPKRDVEKNAETVVKTMLNTPYEWAHCVPIVVEMSVGKDWASKEEVGVFESDRWKGVVEIKKNYLA